MKAAKSCPKCGGSASMTVTVGGERGGGWVSCRSGSCSFIVYAGEGDPAIKWNEIADLVSRAKRAAK